MDDDTGDSSGDYETAISQGQALDAADGSRGWAGLQTEVANEDETIALAYTSGTTGRPKGVEYTSRGSYLAAVANVIESGLNYESGRCRFLWTLPLFHAMGWTFPWAVTAARGTHYCLRAIDYPIIWRLLKEEKITHYNAAPTVNTLLCAAKEAGRLEQPVRVTVAASPPTPALFERMESLNLYPVHVFGMTETYGPITKGYRLPQWEELEAVEKYRKMARQGHGFVASLPIRVVKVKKEEGEYGEGDEVLVDVKQDGKEIGEIVCLGNICAKGYYKDPEATRKLFKGGVLHTGDLAVWHEDGSAQILDRAKDVIISGRFPLSHAGVLHLHSPFYSGDLSRLTSLRSGLFRVISSVLWSDLISYGGLTPFVGGENISSVSLESMLATHPDILEAAVVAVADKQWGERPKAYVTVQEGKTLQGEDVIKWAKGNSAISGFMVPREVEVVEELPKTSTGKVKKNVLREWTKGAARES